MNLKFDVAKKTIKELNSDDFSAEDLNSYIFELNNDLIKVNKEIEKVRYYLSSKEFF